MNKPMYQAGRWRVMRFCCTSGLCVDCHQRGNHGDKAKRKQLIHTDRVSEDWAKYVAANWHDYGATAEPMEKTNAETKA